MEVSLPLRLPAKYSVYTVWYIRHLMYVADSLQDYTIKLWTDFDGIFQNSGHFQITFYLLRIHFSDGTHAARYEP